MPSGNDAWERREGGDVETQEQEQLEQRALVSVTATSTTTTTITEQTAKPRRVPLALVWVGLRLREEADLMRRHALTMLSLVFFLVYVALVVFRNFAYYRHVALQAPLKDLGHQLVPELKGVGLSLIHI